MEIFPKDIKEKIVNELSPERLCAKKEDVLSERLCNDQLVWLRRLQKDFGYKLRQEKNYKNIYLEIFTTMSKSIENIYKNILKTLGDKFLKFVSKDFTIELYQLISKVILWSLSEENIKIDLVLEILPVIYREVQNTEKIYRIFLTHVREMKYEISNFLRSEEQQPSQPERKKNKVGMSETVEDKLNDLPENKLLDITGVTERSYGARLINFPRGESRYVRIPGTVFAVNTSDANPIEGVMNTANFLNMPDIIVAYEKNRK